MGQPVSINLAYDGGWTDGDPGEGRLRFDNPKLAKIRFAYVNARDADEALLNELVPSWKAGDVLVVERSGAEGNRIVCWIGGPVQHRGTYYKVPVFPRAIRGNFTDHDEVSLTCQPNEVNDAAEPAPVAPMAAAVVHTVAQPVSEPIAPVAGTVAADFAPQLDVLDRRVTALERFRIEADDRLFALEATPGITVDLIKRLSEVESRMSAPVRDDDDDLPAFLRPKGANGRSEPPPASNDEEPPAPVMTPAQQIMAADIIARVDELERARYSAPPPAQPIPPPRIMPRQRIEAAVRDLLARAPPVRVVETAHLARQGQEVPIQLMERLGQAMQCGWEDAAVSIIRASDNAAAAAVEAFALQIEAQGRLGAGEDAERVADETISRLEAIGG